MIKYRAFLFLLLFLTAALTAGINGIDNFLPKFYVALSVYIVTGFVVGGLATWANTRL